MTYNLEEPYYFEKVFQYPISIHPFSAPPLIFQKTSQTGADSIANHIPTHDISGLYALRNNILSETDWTSPSTKCLSRIYQLANVYNISVSKSGKNAFTISNEKAYMKASFNDEAGRISFFYNNGIDNSEFEALDISENFHTRFVRVVELIFKRWALMFKYEQFINMEKTMRDYFGNIPSIFRSNFGRIDELMNLSMFEESILNKNGVVRELSDGWYINFYSLRDRFMNSYDEKYEQNTIDISLVKRIISEFNHQTTNVTSRLNFGAHLSVVENEPFIRINIKDSVDPPLLYMLTFDRPIMIPFRLGQELLSIIFETHPSLVRPTDYPSLEELLLQSDTSSTNEVVSLFKIEDIKYCFRNLLIVDVENSIPAIEITHLYFRKCESLPLLLQKLRVQLYINELFTKCFAHSKDSIQSNKSNNESFYSNKGDQFQNARNVEVKLSPPNIINISSTFELGNNITKLCNIRIFVQDDLSSKVIVMIGDFQDQSLQEQCETFLNKFRNIPLLLHFLIKKLK